MEKKLQFNNQLVQLSILQKASINILVYPATKDCPKDAFDHYFALISAVDSFPISQILSNVPKTHSIANYLHKNAWININFTKSANNDTFDFASNDQVFGAIGISTKSYNNNNNTYTSHENYSRVSSRFPSILVHRILFFPSPDNTLNEMESSPPGQDPSHPKVVIVPSQSDSTVVFYLNTLLVDILVDLVLSIHDLLLTMEKKQVVTVPNLPAHSSSLRQQQYQHRLMEPSKSVVSVNSISSTGESSGNVVLSNLQHSRPSSATNVLNSHSDSNFTTISTSGPSQSSNFIKEDSISNLNTFNEVLKEKRRLGGRIQKITGDLYLIIGCWPRALSLYESAVDTSKANLDYLFHAGALEGLIVTQILLLLSDLTADANAKHSDRFVKYLSELDKIADEVCSLYEKSEYYDFKVYFSLKLAGFICLFCPSISDSPREKEPKSPVERLVGDDIEMVENLIQQEPAYIKSSLNITKPIAASFIMKAWDSNIEHLPSFDQIYICSIISRLFGLLSYKRKSAFYLRQTALLLSQSLQRQEKIQFLPEDNRNYLKSKQLIMSVLSVLNLYGINSPTPPPKAHIRGKYGLDLIHTGWSDLQEDVTREAIMICELLHEYHYLVLILCLYLRFSISNRLTDRQESIYSGLKRCSSKLTYHANELIHISNFPDVTDISFACTKVDYMHAISHSAPLKLEIAISKEQDYPIPFSVKAETAVELERSPFIYNPFEKKNQKTDNLQFVAVLDEIVYFNVELKNSLDIPLNVENVCLVFNRPIGGSCLTTFPLSLPPRLENSKTQISFSVQVKEVGTLSAYGLIVKLGNGWTEFIHLYPSPLSTTCFLDVKSVFSAPAVSKGFEMDVIPHFPLLKVKSTSLINNSNLILFEGESRNVDIVLENIGTAPTDKLECFVFSTIDSSASDIVSLYEQECFACSEILVHDIQTRVIKSGEDCKIIVSVKGRKGLSAGVIEIVYGLTVSVGSSEKIYFRRIRLEFKITVKNVLSVEYIGFLEYEPDKFAPNEFISFSKPTSPVVEDGRMRQTLSVEELLLVSPDISLKKAEDSCLFVCDIRNTWTHPFYINFYANASADFSHSALDPRLNPIKEDENVDGTHDIGPILIYPSQTKRIAIPVRKLNLDSLFEYITETSSEDGQFIIPKIPGDPISFAPPVPLPRSKQYFTKPGGVNFASTINTYLKSVKRKIEYQGKSMLDLKNCWWMKVTGEGVEDLLVKCEEEVDHRLLFWYKDQFFRQCIRGATWKSAGSFDNDKCPSGYLSLRSTSFSRDTIRNLKSSRIKIKIELIGNSNSEGRDQWCAMLNEFVKMKITVCSEMEGIYVARLQSFQDCAESDGKVTYDLRDKLVMYGSNQRVMEFQKTSKYQEWDTQLYFTSIGQFKFIAHVQQMDSPCENQVINIKDESKRKWSEVVTVDVIR